MSVELDPVELGFKRPFNHEVSQVLRLYNPNTDPVAFKVKTTAPKQYCVRPNSGRIEAGKDVEVQVLLQAMKEDPPPDARCRDKFLVQSVAISADKESSNVSSIWSQIEQTAKSSIQEKKIRVVFLPAEGSVNGISHSDDAPPSYTNSPTPAPRTPQQQIHSLANAREGTDVMSTPDDRPAGSKNVGEAVQSANNPATDGSPLATVKGAASGAAATVASAIPTSQDDVKRQLEEAKATISRLREQVADQGLRQRKSDAVNQDSKERITTGTTGMGIQQLPASGVPVQIVAGLCLLCFLIAYFFF